MRPLHRLFFLGLILAGSLLALSGCRETLHRPKPIALAGSTMGTSYLVKVNELPQGMTKQQLQAEIDARLETVNDQMSTYRPDSELSRFNRYEESGWFSVSPATAQVVSEAHRISRLSQGAFDVTVGPLVNLWNFGPEMRENQIPTDEEIANAQKQVGYQYLQVRTDPPALKKANTELYVDLSAIAKGFGVDVLAEYLESKKIKGYMVEIGGETRAHGNKPDGSTWKIGVEAPTDRPGTLHKIVELKDQALATSGDYRNYFEKNGHRFSHTIDPRTGRPVTHRLASVSIIADTCMKADALATTLMVLGPGEGYNLAQEQNWAVYFIVRNEDGFSVKTTPAFQEILENP